MPRCPALHVDSGDRAQVLMLMRQALYQTPVFPEEQVMSLSPGSQTLFLVASPSLCSSSIYRVHTHRVLGSGTNHAPMIQRKKSAFFLLVLFHLFLAVLTAA